MPHISTRSRVAWPSEPGSGQGRSHGTSSREPFDRWFRYPAGFASDYVGLLLDRLEVTEGTVVDCFAGSGVTGTAARARGLGFAGIEAHPLVAELARLKLAPIASADEVRALATEVAKRARNAEYVATGASAEPDLIQRSFSDNTLPVLLALKRLIKERIDNPAALYLKWALIGTLRDVAAVKVGWPYQRPGLERKPRYNDPLGRFEARTHDMADDLELVAGSGPWSGEIDGTGTPGTSGATAQVIVGDSRNPETWAQFSEQATACVASPPYLNNFDYADATRLELYFWGEISSWGDMCREVRGDMLTATTQQSSVREMKAAKAALEQRAAGPGGPVEEILTIVDAMTQAKRRRGRRSKEYDQVAPAYFLAVWDILRNLYQHLTPGSSALWLVGDSAPYGVYVDTPRLIGDLAEQVGFQFAEDVRLRTRGNRWGQNADRHKVPLAERIIVFNKRGDRIAQRAQFTDQGPSRDEEGPIG